MSGSRRAEAWIGLVGAVALAGLLAGCDRGADEPPRAVPAEVIAQLKRGINVSRWFDHRDDPGYLAERSVPSAADLAQLHRAGLRHVRLTVDPRLLIESETRGSIRHGPVQELIAAIDRIRTAGLMTVLVIQPREGSKARISEDPTLRTGFARFWGQLAGALREVPPRWLVLELLNEPETENAAASRAMFVEVLQAVRASAPDHTVVVAGHRWSSVEALAAMTPLADGNLVYGFHFYEPHNFTHQGADWGWPMWRRLAGLPYPSSPEAVRPPLEFLPADTHPHVVHYGEERWNRARLASLLDRAARFARDHRVPVWCSEFGVYRYNVHTKFRNAWLGDMRELMAERLIGWSLWNFSGHFGLVQGTQGQRRADPDELRALGLDPDAFPPLD